MKSRRLVAIDPLMKKWGALTTPSIAMKNGKPHINLSRLNRDILRTPAYPARNSFKSAPAHPARSMIFSLTAAKAVRPGGKSVWWVGCHPDRSYSRVYFG